MMLSCDGLKEVWREDIGNLGLSHDHTGKEKNTHVT